MSSFARSGGETLSERFSLSSLRQLSPLFAPLSLSRHHVSCRLVFSLGWSKRPLYRCWLYPIDGWVLEQLQKEQARSELKEKERRDALQVEMQRLIYSKSALGLQYFAPVIEVVVETVAPKGPEERVGQAVAEIRDLAAGRECLASGVLSTQTLIRDNSGFTQV
jgi:hypothetical protein